MLGADVKSSSKSLTCYWLAYWIAYWPAGSWAGPAWFEMLLGLGGNQGGGGGEKGRGTSAVTVMVLPKTGPARSLSWSF